jgi:hypothetical protein
MIDSLLSILAAGWTTILAAGWTTILAAGWTTIPAPGWTTICGQTICWALRCADHNAGLHATVNADRAADRVEHHVVIERLQEMADGARLFDTLACRRIVMGGDEDDRHGQTLLEIEAAQLIHVDIENQAGRATAGQPLEEFTRGRERLRRVTGRLNQTMERTTDRRIVVYDGNDRYFSILHVKPS